MKNISTLIVISLVCIGIYTGKDVYAISACAFVLLCVLHGQVRFSGDFKTRMFDDEEDF